MIAFFLAKRKSHQISLRKLRSTRKIQFLPDNGKFSFHCTRKGNGSCIQIVLRVVGKFLLQSLCYYLEKARSEKVAHTHTMLYGKVSLETTAGRLPQ